MKTCFMWGKMVVTLIVPVWIWSQTGGHLLAETFGFTSNARAAEENEPKPTLPSAPGAALPGRYFHLMAAELARVERRLRDEPAADLKALEAGPNARHFPGALLAAAVLHAKAHPENPAHGDKQKLGLALNIGDLLVRESEKGNFQLRLDHHRDTYMWLEAYRLLEQDLGESRRARWRQELHKNVAALAADVAERVDYPRYQSPFIRTSPNHYALWASTVYLAGRTFGNTDWERLGACVLRRFATEEQTRDGYWGEHNDSGPTPGYNYLTFTGVALYYEHSHDPAALDALRRATDFHKNFTWPDGTPVDVVNDRNRYWSVSPWGHFGFSHFPDGRRYAEFLTGFFREGSLGYETLGRMAQNALYFCESPTAPILQDLPRYVHQLSVPAAMRKTGPWVVCLSGLISTRAVTNQFYLDRQGHLSVFHQRLGLIITGANSKRQPELATFREKVGGEVSHLPISSRLRMSPLVKDVEESASTRGDRLALAYNTFFAELEVETRSETQVVFRFTIVERGRLEEGYLTLQLCLKAGEVLETRTSRIVLGAERVELETQDLGGFIRHGGWTLTTDAPAQLIWPVYPFNPYANGPETGLSRTVGALVVPLRPIRQPGARSATQEITFTLRALPSGPSR